jgi:hypothetical protein
MLEPQYELGLRYWQSVGRGRDLEDLRLRGAYARQASDDGQNGRSLAHGIHPRGAAVLRPRECRAGG